MNELLIDKNGTVELYKFALFTNYYYGYQINATLFKRDHLGSHYRAEVEPTNYIEVFASIKP
jgi:hypothetical protein